MDLVFDIVGTIILVSVVATIILLPFIGIWRGIMIQKTWVQAETIVIGHEFYLGFMRGPEGHAPEGNRLPMSRHRPPGSARINIKYTIDGSVYESFYYKGRSRHHILPPVGTREIRYYNPEKPYKTFSKEDCDSKIKNGIIYLIVVCILALFIILF